MCKHFFTPVAKRGELKPEPRFCTKPIWKDDFCKIHHPEMVEEKRVKEERWRAECAEDKKRYEMEEYWERNPEKVKMLNHFAGIALPVFLGMKSEDLPFDYSDYYGDETTKADEYAMAAYNTALAMLKALESVMTK